MANFTRTPPPELAPPAEPKLDQLAPWAFVGLGVGMIAVAAADYLAASVAVAFVVLGAGLVALGGLAARIEGTVKLGLQGFEFALRARQALLEAQREVETRDPEEAKRLAGKVQELDDWFEEYQRIVAERRITNPFTRAALMKATYLRAMADQHAQTPPDGQDDG